MGQRRTKELRAGAAAVDITPETLPVISSGGFLESTADQVHDSLFARGLVLDDGAKRIALVVVDTLMMPRELLDRVKREASAATGIREEHMLIAATHTHSAPSVMGALGSRCDETYAAFLPDRLVECIRQTDANRVPARVGWAGVTDTEDTNCRVWIRRPDRIGTDPFGDDTIRAMMHPGYQNPDYIGPCGPEDPVLSMLAVQTAEGLPLALLANYSMHYFGAPPVSADYFGAFCSEMERRIAPTQNAPRFVAMMSHGTSGDQHWMDYSQPKKDISIDTYAARVADKAMEAWQRVDYADNAALGMAETKLELDRRTPSPERLAWAKKIRAAMGERTVPKDKTEVYALEQLYLDAEPRRELRLQALRVRNFAITAIPCEVYAISGLKLKRRSPFALTMNIELANGAEGYIPPPELHPFGGYNTWPARTAGLETTAEPKIVEAVVRLLEGLGDKKQRPLPTCNGPYTEAARRSTPRAYWPMDTIAGEVCADLSGNNMAGKYEPCVAYFLEGAPIKETGHPDGICRAAHFAGGRMAAKAPDLGEAYSVQLWFWNGLPNDARTVTGYFFSRGRDGEKGAPGEHLGIGGTYRGGNEMGRLIAYNGDEKETLLIGTSVLEPTRWYCVTYVRNGREVAAYLDGRTTPEFSGTLELGCPTDTSSLWLGGRSDGILGFEGKLCHVSLYDRALTPGEAAAQYQTAGVISTRL
ncbi:MAG: LamG-like jellyroll fold domain-containing protein [Candidatus Hydrogenedentota bacterium]